MADVSWQAAADGRYWIDVIIGEQPVQVMIDLGLVDPAHVVGFELDPGGLLEFALRLALFS